MLYRVGMRWQNMREFKYSEILETNILDKFDDQYRNQISELKLCEENGYFIDVKKICEIIGIKIEKGDPFGEFDVSDSGHYDDKKNIITVNPLDHSNRERFTIAHELGHALLGHEGKSFRSASNEKYKDIIAKMKETSANKFAAELLMPKKLVKALIIKELKDKDKTDHFLSTFEYESLIEKISSKLQVSKEALSISIKNYNLIKRSNNGNL